MKVDISALIHDWKVWALAILLVGSVGYAMADRAADRREVDRLEDVADAQAARADSAEARADSLASISDSLEAANDSVQAREQALRDTLSRQIANAREETSAAEISLDAASVDEDSAIAHALQVVDRPEERQAIRLIARADSAEDTNRDRLLAGMQRQVALLHDSNASLEREKTQVEETLVGVAEERDSLRSVVREKNRTIDDKDRVIAALREPWWQSVLGGSIVEGVATAGSGALSYFVAGEKGAAGWTIAKVADLLVEQI